MNKDLHTLFETQKIEFLKRNPTSAQERLNRLKKMQHSLHLFEEEILTSLKEDLNRDPFESFISEIYLIKKELSTALCNLNHWIQPRTISTTCYLVPQPKGTVLIITPWNYPFLLTLSPLIGAISAGNTAIIKTSEYAPHTSKVIQRYIESTFSHDEVAVVEGGSEIGASLTQLPFDHIFFTGSPEVGRLVMKSAAEKLTPLTLELGGKNPCIIDKQVDTKKIADTIIWAKFLNAGQSCLAPDYLLVHQDIKEKLCKHLIESIIKFYSINPLKNHTYPKIIHQKRFKRLLMMLEKMPILYGGKSNPDELKIEPTLIDNPAEDSIIMQEEIFGPLLPLITYSSLDQIIKKLHEKPKPLALYLFSDNKNVQKKIIYGTESGGITLNNILMHGINTHIPFGGIGLSGFGKYHGKYSFETFSHLKPISIEKRWLQPLLYPPYGSFHTILKKIIDFFPYL